MDLRRLTIRLFREKDGYNEEEGHTYTSCTKCVLENKDELAALRVYQILHVPLRMKLVSTAKKRKADIMIGPAI